MLFSKLHSSAFRKTSKVDFPSCGLCLPFRLSQKLIHSRYLKLTESCALITVFLRVDDERETGELWAWPKGPWQMARVTWLA